VLREAVLASPSMSLRSGSSGIGVSLAMQTLDPGGRSESS
jgi:hypothetical protein